MSHTVTIKTEVRDPAAIEAACRRLGLQRPVQGSHELFDGTRCAGFAVRLPNWQLPAICEHQTGKVHFDNYGGRWGEQRELDHFLQMYAVEKARIESRKLGHNVSEAAQADGSILLTINT